MSETAKRGADQDLRNNLADVYGTYQQWSDKDGPSGMDGFTRANDATPGTAGGRDSDSDASLSSVADRLAAVLRSGQLPPEPMTAGDA